MLSWSCVDSLSLVPVIFIVLGKEVCDEVLSFYSGPQVYWALSYQILSHCNIDFFR